MYSELLRKAIQVVRDPDADAESILAALRHLVLKRSTMRIAKKANNDD